MTGEPAAAPAAEPEVSESLVDFLAAGLCAYNRHRRDQHQVAGDLLTLLVKHPDMQAAVAPQLTAQDVPHVAAQVRAEVYREFRHERAHRPGDEFAWCVDCTDDFRAPWPCAWERHLDNLERQLHGDAVDQLECGAAPN